MSWSIQCLLKAVRRARKRQEPVTPVERLHISARVEDAKPSAANPSTTRSTSLSNPAADAQSADRRPRPGAAAPATSTRPADSPPTRNRSARQRSPHRWPDAPPPSAHPTPVHGPHQTCQPGVLTTPPRQQITICRPLISWPHLEDVRALCVVSVFPVPIVRGRRPPVRRHARG